MFHSIQRESKSKASTVGLSYLRGIRLMDHTWRSNLAVKGAGAQNMA